MTTRMEYSGEKIGGVKEVLRVVNSEQPVLYMRTERKGVCRVEGV